MPIIVDWKSKKRRRGEEGEKRGVGRIMSVDVIVLAVNCNCSWKKCAEISLNRTNLQNLADIEAFSIYGIIKREQRKEKKPKVIHKNFI